MRRVEVFKHRVHCDRGHGPVGLLLCAAVTAAHRQRWTGAALASYARRRPSVWL